MKHLLLTAVLLIASPVHAEITDEVKKMCMDAKDFEGCVKVFTKGKDPDPQMITVDFLGRPIIPGWKQYDFPEDNEVFYVSPDILQVKVRGMFGRYIFYQYVHRFYQEYVPGRAGSSTAIGSATTNCYGYGSSVNCTSTPATVISTPGRSAVPSGVRQEKWQVFIDCLDKKAQWDGRGKWKNYEDKRITSRVAERNCGRIPDLPKAKDTSHAKGSPNSRDKLAAKTFYKGR